ncbi:DUF1540 domain-containing protein [Brevibacillus ginsengisoli]|uniref:DUF1540 domain-containing protein n=1 Tax=Brevibacillus ginsengisoli TaxID=363854 RepID=UPI003CEFFDF6
MPQVKCSVSNCSYWGQGNNCQADMIMVEIDKHSKTKYNTEFADEYGYDSKHHDTASSAAHTCCHTFKAKNA